VGSSYIAGIDPAETAQATVQQYFGLRRILLSASVVGSIRGDHRCEFSDPARIGHDAAQSMIIVTA